MSQEDQNIHPDDSARLMEQGSHVIWFTGLSGAGKSLSLIHISEPTRPY